MAIQIADGFQLRVAKPLDDRQNVETVAQLDPTYGYEGQIVYVKDIKQFYTCYKDENGNLAYKVMKNGGEGGASTASEVSYSNEALSSVLDVKMALDTIVGEINEISGTQLDTVGFSADYKNIILNRKSGLNPYTIPIASIINNTSLTELKDIDSTDIGNGKTIVYNSVTQKHKYVNTTLTDELVKMDSATDAHYLADLIDKSTIVNEDGILKVKMLDGQDVTIAEINHLKGLTMNVMDLVNSFANGGVKVLNTPVATYADLTTLDRSAFIEGISYIVYVLADETHTGAKTTYLCDKTNSTYFGNADSQRNFTTNPIDLANEITGKLDNSHIDIDNLWTLLTINDTYKTLTTNNEIFGTHGAKAMYDELTTAIGEKANTSDLTTTDDITDTIDINSSGTKIPNVKAIYNDIIIGKNIDQTVIDTYGTEILKYPLGIWKIGSDDTANKFAGLPVKTSGRIEITSIDANTNKNPWNSSWSYRVYNFETYTGINYFRKVTTASIAGNTSTDTGWQKVCTTTVADVGVTTITPVNSAITGTIEYTVKNGICYVSLINVKSTTNSNGLSMSTTMPKSAINSHSAIFKQVGNGNIGIVYITKNTTQLTANIYISDIIGDCSFSYPVAE